MTGCAYNKSFRADNGNYRRKVSYLRAKLSHLRAARVYARLSASRRIPVVARPVSLCAICGTRVTVGSRKLDDQPRRPPTLHSPAKQEHT